VALPPLKKNKVMEFIQTGQLESIDIVWSPSEGNTPVGQFGDHI